MPETTHHYSWSFLGGFWNCQYSRWIFYQLWKEMKQAWSSTYFLKGTLVGWRFSMLNIMSLMNGMKKMCSSVCSFVTYVQALLKHDRLLNTKEQALAIVEKKRKKNAVWPLLHQTRLKTLQSKLLYKTTNSVKLTPKNSKKPLGIQKKEP